MEYRQIKISVDPDLADAFKDACQCAGVSMAGELSRFMEKRATFLKKQAPERRADTRGKRRKETEKAALWLGEILSAEENYRDSIPENLRGGDAYASACQTAETLEQAIDLLREAF